MNSNLPPNLFSKCHKLEHISLQDNGFSLDQLLDIEDQLLSPLNGPMSYLRIDEKSLKCPFVSNVTFSKCGTVQKINNLFNIAKDTDIQCYDNDGLKLSHEEFSKSVEKCQIFDIIEAICIATGNRNMLSRNKIR